MMLIQNSVIFDWLFNTQSRVLQGDWFILEINEKTTLNVNMPDRGTRPRSFRISNYLTRLAD